MIDYTHLDYTGTMTGYQGQYVGHQDAPVDRRRYRRLDCSETPHPAPTRRPDADRRIEEQTPIRVVTER